MAGRDFETIYAKRFPPAERAPRRKLWKCLLRSCLARFFGRNLTVIDIGCGFCEFINSVKAKKKYAYDIEGAFKKFAGPDVEFIKAQSGKPIPLRDNSCDRVFASNFFEHLSSREEIMFILKEAFRILKPGGRIVAIQPNIALTGGAYWDFFDHIIPLTDKSLLEAMELAGFKKYHLKRRFLPYTTKSIKYKSTALLRLYLTLPFFQWIFAGQSLIIAEKPDE